MPSKRRTRNKKKGGYVPVSPPEPQCQCMDANTMQGCKNKVYGKTIFCKEHQNCPSAPRSGYEPSYDPGRYNNDPAVRKSHNCYSYSMHVIDPKLVEACRQRKTGNCRDLFHQPGALNGDRFALNASERRTCPEVEKLMMSDVPGMTKTTFDKKCPAGTSMIASTVDRGNDHHHYLYHPDGYWSHKPGSNKVTREDALGKPIFNPQYASRDYRHQGSDLNYEDFCGFYCVPRNQRVLLGQGGGISKHLKKTVGGSLALPGLSWKDPAHRILRRQTRRRPRHRVPGSV